MNNNNKGVSYHYQPIVSCNNGDISYYEMLLRLSPEALGNHGNIEKFISSMEINGKIDDIDRFGIELAAKSIDRNGFCDNLPIAVNLSPLTINSNGFINFIDNILSKANNPERLFFEITERQPITDNEKLTEFIELVHLYGGKVALDDFGSGYTNLNLINSFDFDYIKIDGDFITNFNEEFINVVTEASRGRGNFVVAEKIESKHDHYAVLKLGVSHMQGYYIARPGAIPVSQNSISKIFESENRKAKSPLNRENDLIM